MKITIQKFEKETKYVLPNFIIKIDQKSNFVIIISKIVKKLKFKIKLITIFANYFYTIFVINKNFIKLISQIKF